MKTKERLKRELSNAEEDLRRAKILKGMHEDRSNRREAKLAKKFIDTDSERVRKLRQELGKE